jgi:hypothetical protein
MEPGDRELVTVREVDVDQLYAVLRSVFVAGSTSARSLSMRGGEGHNRKVEFCPNCGRSAPAAALFCPSCGSPIAVAPEPSEERKLATVLFADLVGSTALADSQDAERTRALLNRFYDAMSAEIAYTGGTPDLELEWQQSPG